MLLKGAVAGGVMTAGILLLRQLHVHWSAQFVAGLLLYPAVLLLLKAVTMEELQIVLKAVDPRKRANSIPVAAE